MLFNTELKRNFCISSQPCNVLDVRSPSVYKCIQVVMIDQLMNYLFPVLDKPENVMLTVNDSNICKGDIISITCSADGKPDVDTYQLFENDTPVPDSDTAGEWQRTMSAQRNFTYRCVAKNTAGTSDKNVTVTVNGNWYFFFAIYM